MTPEQESKPLTVLREQVKRYDKAIGQVNGLIQEPVKIVWKVQPRLEDFSGEQFLKKAEAIGRKIEDIVESLKSKSLPRLQKNREKIDDQIGERIKGAQEKVATIEFLVEKGLLREEVLKRAREEFSSLQEKQPEALPSQAETGAGEEELYKYTTADMAKAVVGATGISEKSALSKTNDELKRHPNIKPMRRYISHGKGAHRVFFFIKEQMDSIVAAASEVKGRRQKGQSQEPAPESIIPQEPTPEPTPEPTTPPAPQAITTEAPPPSEPVITPVLDRKPPDQDKLTFKVDGKFITIPKKERYTNEDVAAAIGRSNINGNVRNTVRATMRRDQTITARTLGTGKGHKQLLFDEENFIKIVAAIMPRMRAPRGPRKIDDVQSPPETPVKEIRKEDKIDFVEIDNSYITLDGGENFCAGQGNPKTHQRTSGSRRNRGCYRGI